jgi:hypothetical protein
VALLPQYQAYPDALPPQTRSVDTVVPAAADLRTIKL